jgi:hypothetical protein
LGFSRAVGLKKSCLLGRSAFHLSNALFHLLAGFEGNHELLWYKDFIASSWIAGLPGCPPFYFEHPEISQFDPMVLDQRLNDCVKRLLDDLFRLKLGEPNLFGDGFNDLFLGHLRVPFENGHNCESPTPVAAFLMTQV